MRRSAFAVLIPAVLAAVVLTPGTSAQLASSTNHQLLDLSFDHTGGASSSETTVAFWTLDSWSGNPAASVGFTAEPGLLGSREVLAPAGPLVFAVVPDIGDRQGGDPVTVHGMNLIVGTTVAIGTAPLMGTTVVSPSLVTGTTGSPLFGIVGYGPQDVTATNGMGTGTRSDGFIAEPALIASRDSFQGANWVLDAYGEPGQTFQTWVSPTTMAPLVAPTDYGQVQIGPHIVSLLFLTTPYGPDGRFRFEFEVPIDPILVGFTAYLQGLHFGDIAPGELTNQTQTTFH